MKDFVLCRFFNCRKSYAILSIVVYSFIFSCSGSGVQGSSLFSKFQGISTAIALSPTAIQLTWGLDAQFS